MRLSVSLELLTCLCLCLKFKCKIKKTVIPKLNSGIKKLFESVHRFTYVKLKIQINPIDWLYL
jgi:hypothetical protein